MNRQEYLHDLERAFLRIVPVEPTVAAQNLRPQDEQGGVYAIWEGPTMRYFGETCHVAHRVLEIVDIGRHHSLNLLMGQEAAGKKGREKSAWFSKSAYRISWMVVEIGRAELEEYMLLKHATNLRNHQGVRFSLRKDLPAWREMIKEPSSRYSQCRDLSRRVRSNEKPNAHYEIQN